MKRYLLLFTFVLSLLATNVFSQTVYITKTGEKYHTETCRYLSKSKIAISLEDAKAKGYEACKVCKPSTVTKSSSVATQQKATKTEPKPKTTTTTKTYSSSRQCSAYTKSGTRCKRMTKSPNGKCYQHGGN